ncbi:MAG: hypothetical protein LBB45_07560 [Methanobrevibacter sp.]|jgi:hypothetical protein|nr:hypothetical protein [Candidatus Methanovirga basalitermitum]
MSKVKIIDAKVNKKLIGDEVTYKKISPNTENPKKGGKGGDDSRKPKQPSLREIVLQFINEQKEFNKRIETKVDNLDDKVNNVIKLNNLKS